MCTLISQALWWWFTPDDSVRDSSSNNNKKPPPIQHRIASIDATSRNSHNEYLVFFAEYPYGQANDENGCRLTANDIRKRLLFHQQEVPALISMTNSYTSTYANKLIVFSYLVLFESSNQIGGI